MKKDTRFLLALFAVESKPSTQKEHTSAPNNDVMSKCIAENTVVGKYRPNEWLITALFCVDTSGMFWKPSDPELVCQNQSFVYALPPPL
jgi:hypothetical protein